MVFDSVDERIASRIDQTSGMLEQRARDMSRVFETADRELSSRVTESAAFTLAWASA